MEWITPILSTMQGSMRIKLNNVYESALKSLKYYTNRRHCIIKYLLVINFMKICLSFP